MNTRLLAVAGAAALLLGSSIPVSAANTFAVQVNASTIATIAVTMVSGTHVVCDPGTAVTGTVACTNAVNASGNIRTTKGGVGSLTTAAPASTVTGTGGNTLPVAALKMTRRPAPTLRRPSERRRLGSTGVSCASWRRTSSL